MTHIVIGALEYFINACGSQKKAASKLGISAAYLSDVMNGRREITDKLAAKVGWKKQITWVSSHSEIGV